MLQVAMEGASSSDVAATSEGETLVPQVLQFSIGQGGNIHMAKHVRYFMCCLKGLTFHYAGNDLNRLMVVSTEQKDQYGCPLGPGTWSDHVACLSLVQAYFCVNALDMLGAIDKIPKRDIIEWIYALQVEPGSKSSILPMLFSIYTVQLQGACIT